MSLVTQEQARQNLDKDNMTITYLGGGSREWAPKFVQDMALSNINGEVRLYDIDYESAQLNARFGNWVQDKEEAVADWTYRAFETLDEALEGSDAVILSTQFNPAETFVHDLEISKEYGIYGAVGVTIGPSGIFRAMRTIPIYKQFAAKIRENCPDAWVFNFTNPVHFITRALYDEYPDINAIGLCHEVLHSQSYFASLAEEYLNMDVDQSDITINLKGINHFTWVDEASCKGIDLWPLLEDLLSSERANQKFTSEDLEGVTPFIDNQQVAWELFRRFDIFPVAGDRHLVEYATWFLNGGKEGLNRWGVKRTDSEYRSKHWDPSESDQTTDVTSWLEGEKDFHLESSGEVFADILEALAGGEPFVTNVNMPNQGQIRDIEQETVVETNALVRANDITPLTAGSFSRPIRGIIVDHVNTVETVIEAARTGNLDEAFKGFLIDPQIRTLQTEDARDLFAELVAVEEEYLSDWDLEGSKVLAESSKY